VEENEMGFGQKILYSCIMGAITIGVMIAEVHWIIWGPFLFITGAMFSTAFRGRG